MTAIGRDISITIFTASSSTGVDTITKYGQIQIQFYASPTEIDPGSVTVHAHRAICKGKDPQPGPGRWPSSQFGASG